MTPDEELDIREPAEALGNELRSLRIRASLTVSDLAEQCDMSASKLSRIELARIVPSEIDVRKIATTLGASATTVDDLTTQAQLLRRGKSHHPLLPQVGGDDGQHIRKLERRSTRIQSFELGILPGLLQTAGYMRASANKFIAAGHLLDSESGNFLVQRMERAAMLMHPRKQFEFVISWSALATRHADNPTMAAQCDHLINVITEYPNVHIGLIPQEHVLPYPVFCGFTAYNDRIVVTETFSRYIVIDEPSEVQFYISFHELARDSAVYGDKAIEIIEKLKSELFTNQETHDFLKDQ